MPNEVTALNAETQKEARKMLERVAKLSDEIWESKDEYSTSNIKHVLQDCRC